MCNYLKKIWDARYFWAHLVLSDLRSRWRRSLLGVLWSIIHPLIMTLMITLVLGRFFKVDASHYAPYILSGMVVWECIVSTATNGAMAFVQADAYIKQCRHPLVIYTLRIALANIIVLLMASVALVLWAIVALPSNINWSWLGALLFFPLLLIVIWPMATVFAYIGARFRDLPYALSLAFQALWFISPVYFEERFFREARLGALVDYNPIYHLLETLRAPILNGTWPTSADYAGVLLTSLIAILLAWSIGRRAESKVIFYL